VIRHLCFVAGSPAISLQQLTEVVAAVRIQMERDVCALWGLVAPEVSTVSEPGAVPEGACQLLVTTTSDTKDAAGYHTIDMASGMPIGYIFTDKLEMDDITATISHEASETIVDPFVSDWAWSDTKMIHVAKEISDPVEGRTYRINGVAVSDFVVPEYFSDATPADRWVDFMKVLRGPWSIDQAAGGYISIMTKGRTGQQPPESRIHQGGACYKCSKRGHGACHPTARHYRRAMTPARPHRLALDAHPVHAVAQP